MTILLLKELNTWNVVIVTSIDSNKQLKNDHKCPQHKSLDSLIAGLNYFSSLLIPYTF